MYSCRSVANGSSATFCRQHRASSKTDRQWDRQTYDSIIILQLMTEEIMLFFHNYFLSVSNSFSSSQILWPS